MTMTVKRDKAGDFITMHMLASCPLRLERKDVAICLHPCKETTEYCELQTCPLVDVPLAFRLSKGLIDDARKTDKGSDSGVVHPKVHLDGPGSVSD